MLKIIFFCSILDFCLVIYLVFWAILPLQIKFFFPTICVFNFALNFAVSICIYVVLNLLMSENFSEEVVPGGGQVERGCRSSMTSPLLQPGRQWVCQAA